MTTLTKQQNPSTTMELYEDRIFDICEKHNIALEEKSKILQERADNLKHMLYDNVVAMPLNKLPTVENNTGELIFFNEMSKIICEKTWADKKSKVNKKKRKVNKKKHGLIKRVK
jgi:hypothetical protein